MPIHEPPVKRDPPWPPGRMAKLEPVRDFKAQWQNLSAMTEEERRNAWQFLKVHRPALAALLTDPFVQEMRAMFGADIYIESKELREGDA